MLALFGTIPTGLTFEPEEDNPQELIGNYFPGSPDGVSCPALPRPSFPSAVDIVRGAGEVKAFSRPVAIVEAQAERIGGVRQLGVTAAMAFIRKAGLDLTPSPL
jgi:hypothetical protein